jgi:hypothetical protein
MTMTSSIRLEARGYVKWIDKKYELNVKAVYWQRRQCLGSVLIHLCLAGRVARCCRLTGTCRTKRAGPCIAYVIIQCGIDVSSRKSVLSYKSELQCSAPLY